MEVTFSTPSEFEGYEQGRLGMAILLVAVAPGSRQRGMHRIWHLIDNRIFLKRGESAKTADRPR